MRELVDLAAAGKVRTHVGRTAPLSKLGEVFDDLEAGRYVGRGVLTDMTR
jgi:D-arabinose 1-dehydrogenase-like Zn-dependent alcohol dehydrogenase